MPNTVQPCIAQKFRQPISYMYLKTLIINLPFDITNFSLPVSSGIKKITPIYKRKNTRLHTRVETFCYSCGINKVSCTQTAHHMRI